MKEEAADGGWPAAFQQLRRLPFSEEQFGRLHGWFFTESDVVAGSRESRTRRGTLRVTPRVVRTAVRIAAWPRLHARLVELLAAGARQPALQHLRCLECYLQRIRHPAQPRILRDAQEPAAVAAAGSEVVETISLLDSSEE